MFATSRIVYGRTGLVTPVWMWLLQRISAVLLGPLVFVHVSIPGAARNPWVDGSLLLVVLSHGYIGLWRLVGRRPNPASSASQAVTALLILLIGAVGILIVRALL
jgi:succinate dehydrogenase hydrophobic anchor subunit